MSGLPERIKALFCKKCGASLFQLFTRNGKTDVDCGSCGTNLLKGV